MKTFIKFPLLIVYLFLYINIASSQEKNKPGSIIGRVIDKITQQALLGANISVIGTKRGDSSNEDGYFRLNKLEEGTYRLRVEYLGYSSLVLTNIRVVRNKITQLKEIELLEVVMEGEAVSVSSGIFREDQENIVSGTHYNQEEIRRSPGSANDVLRSISTIPGVNNSGGEFASYSVRGSGPRDNLILVDNIPFEKVVHFDGSPDEYEDAQGGGFSIFAPYLIEAAEFQGGGFSARYGGKHSSLLKLSVKEGNKENHTLRGTYDLLGWELNYDGPSYLIKNTQLNLSIRRQDFKKVVEMAGMEEVGYPRLTDLIGKITTDIDENNKISLLGIYGPEKFTRNAGHLLKSEKMDDTHLMDVEETRSLLGLNWRMLTGQSGFLHSTFYYRENDQNRQYGKAYPEIVDGKKPTLASIEQRPDIYLLNQKETEYGAKFDYTYQSESKSTFRTGLELTQISLNFKQRQNGPDTLYTFDQNDSRENPAQNFIITRPEMINSTFRGKRSIIGAYAEYSLNSLSGRLTVNPGFRYQYSEFSNTHYYLPRLSASFRLNEKVRFNLAAGLYSQTPRFIDLASNLNNNKLKDELSFHYIGGFTYYIQSDLKFTTELYYKAFDNLIIQNDRSSELRNNNGDGYSYGADFSLVKRLVDKLYGQINYSYSKSERNDHNGLGSYVFDFNRPHIINILFGYEFNHKWALSFKWNYSSGRPRDSYIIHKNVHNDLNHMRYAQEIVSRNTDRTDPIHSLNIRVDYRHQFGQLAVITFLDIFNVYNNRNANQVRFVERNGEMVKVGMGIVPTFGFKFEL